MALNGFGRLIDVKFRTLSCKSKVIVDESCKLNIDDIITKNLIVKKDIQLTGNIVTPMTVF